MELEDKILAFLAQPENIEMAIDVAWRVERLRDHFHAQFWTAVAQELQTRLEKTEHKDAWMISDFNHQHRDYWVNIHITYQLPENILRTPEFITVCLEQGKADSYPFYYGVKWQDRNSQAINRPDFLALKEFLKTSLYPPKDGLWTTITNLDYSARNDKFLLGMAKEQEKFVREIVDRPWQLFMHTAGLLTTINQTTLSILQAQQEK